MKDQNEKRGIAFRFTHVVMNRRILKKIPEQARKHKRTIASVLTRITTFLRITKDQ